MEKFGFSEAELANLPTVVAELHDVETIIASDGRTLAILGLEATASDVLAIASAFQNSRILLFDHIEDDAVCEKILLSGEVVFQR